MPFKSYDLEDIAISKYLDSAAWATANHVSNIRANLLAQRCRKQGTLIFTPQRMSTQLAARANIGY